MRRAAWSRLSMRRLIGLFMGRLFGTVCRIGASNPLMLRMKKGQEHIWQRNPESLTSEQVQYWLASGTMLGLRDLVDAKQAVRDGRAFVVSSQAIGQYDP